MTTRSGSSPATFAISAMKPCQSGNAYPGCRLPSANSDTRSSDRSSSSSSFRARARWKRPSPCTDGAATHRSTPTIAPQKNTQARRGTVSAAGQRRKRRSTAAATATRTSSASVSVRVEPSANVIASAAEHGDERPREARRHAAHAERSREQPPGREDDRGGERELDVEDDHQRPSSAAASPDASHAAPSRYARPRSPRKTSPRRRSDARSRRRARSASFAPRCFQRKSRWPRRFSR